MIVWRGPGRGLAAVLVLLLAPWTLLLAPWTAMAHDVAADNASLVRCRDIDDSPARLACYDALAGRKAGTERQAMIGALDAAFRFDRTVRIAPLRFRLDASGYLSISRQTGPGRDVARLARKIAAAGAAIDGWRLVITVRGAGVSLPRMESLGGARLAAQVTRAMADSGLPPARYEIVTGPDADPLLWDDGRIRGSNEHIMVEVTGL